jgi:hypothetical protein
MSRAGRWVAGVAAFCGIFVIVVVADDDREVKTPAIQVKEVEVEKRVEVKVPTVPQSCKDMAVYSGQLRDAVAQYEDLLGQHQDIIQKSHIAIAHGDIPGLSESDRRHRKLRSDTLEVILTIRDLDAKVKVSRDICLNKTE